MKNDKKAELDKDRFWADGFLIVPRFVELGLVRLLRDIAEHDPELRRQTRTGKDHSGDEVRLWISNRLEENLLSAIVRFERIISAAEQLLGGEVYHWHHKLIFKEAHRGGAWEWHQDYGYWYDYGCLFPDLVSCFIAIDPARRDNGCLQFVRGSHRMGRLDTSRVADQTGATDSRRMDSILTSMETVYCELNPGDAVFFHANALHKSGLNASDRPRWAFISVYNAATNAPREITPVHSHDEDAPPTPYERLTRWPLERIMDVGRKQLEALQPMISPGR